MTLNEILKLTKTELQAEVQRLSDAVSRLTNQVGWMRQQKQWEAAQQ